MCKKEHFKVGKANFFRCLTANFGADGHRLCLNDVVPGPKS